MPETINFHLNRRGEWRECYETLNSCEFSERLEVPISQVIIRTPQEPVRDQRGLTEPAQASHTPTSANDPQPQVTVAWDLAIKSAEADQTLMETVLFDDPDAGNTLSDRSYESASFTIETLIDELRYRPQDAAIRFDSGEQVALKVWSWRGGYTAGQLLGVSPSKAKLPQATVADLIACLEWHVGKKMEGYRGGLFRIYSNTPLYAEWDESISTGQQIKGTWYDQNNHIVQLIRGT